ncbi:MAG: type II toxin-antitoxin system HicB family antitoxin [Dehalococcoidia bacterium]|nr:type II toxin-antitoxin system HicB family antitoxin [Dehalococcoidia bacterium]
MKTYSYLVILHPEEGRYWVSVPALPGCYSQGDTVDGAIDNVREAITLCIEDLVAHGEPIPEESEHPKAVIIDVAA